MPRNTDHSSLNDIVGELVEIRTELLIGPVGDSFDSAVFAGPMFLEGLAVLEASIHKLRQAELFRAREYAGNF